MILKEVIDMRKSYLEPSIEITAFDSENIVTAVSGITGKPDENGTAFNEANENVKRTISFDAFHFTF